MRVAQWIEMAGHEIDDLKLRLSPPFSISGTIAVEIPAGAMAPTPKVILRSHIGRLAQDTGHPAPGPSATASADGNFLLEDVYPGGYNIPGSSEPPYYFDSVLVGGAELLTPEVELSDPMSLVIVYKHDGGAISGKVENCGQGVVILLPQETARQQAALLRSAPCDASGHYQIPAVRPGEDYVLAFTKGSWPRPYNASNIDRMFNRDRLFNQAGRVTVRPGESSSADVTASARPPY